MSKKITTAELRELFEYGFVMRSIWISYDEGYEYHLCKMGYGTNYTLFVRKSPRALYNAFRKYVKDHRLEKIEQQVRIAQDIFEK